MTIRVVIRLPQLIIMKKQNNDPESPQDILKRIEQESSAKKLEQTMDILNRKQPARPSISWWQRGSALFNGALQTKKKQLIRHSRISENRHIVIITMFFLGAIWVSWKIEEKYDRMRSKATSTKSNRQRQIEEENAYIQRMLKRNPFEPVPIEEEEEEQRKYMYQQTAELEFDTRADLLEIMEEEKRLFDRDE